MHLLIKRLGKLHLLLLLIGILVSLLFLGTHSAYADVQKKNAYLIKINRTFNTITIYSKDDKGKYTIPIKAMLCSVGKSNKTKTGTFNTKAKYRWKILMNDVWGQYSTRIDGGMLFHSVYYYDNNPARLATKEFNKLGTAASHGCVRLTVKDAKWIYDNCSVGTTVTIYDDKKSPGPLGKPTPIKIASNVRWDPTDPDKKNPFLKKTPVISGLKDVKVKWNQDLDLLKNVKAKSTVGANITSKIKVSGEVDASTPGVYHIKYSVVDELGKSSSKSITVTVDKNKVAPNFTGIADKIVGENVIIDNSFALKGVNAYCSKYKLDKKLINIEIKKNSNTLYYITYTASVGKGPITTKKSIVRIDNIPPVITGVTDATLEIGETPVKENLLKNVTVSDNYSKSDKIKLTVSWVENPDGSYLVTYEATDEVGNKNVVQCTLTIQNNTLSGSKNVISDKSFLIIYKRLNPVFRRITKYYI